MKKAFILLHISIFLAGFTGIFGRLISINAGLISWYRLLFSSLLLFLYVWISGKLKKTAPSDILQISVVGFLLGLHWIFFYGSIKHSNISVGVVCFSLCSFITAILEPFINRKKHSLPELLLSSLTLLGIALIFGLDSEFRYGIMLGLISALFGALYTIFGERLTKKYDAETITLYTMTGGWFGLTLLIPLYLLISPIGPLLPSGPDLGYLIILSLFCTVLMYLLLTRALRHISAFTVNLSYNLEPLYSIVLAIIIYKENRELSLGFYAGFFLIILSVILQMARVKSSRKIAILNSQP